MTLGEKLRDLRINGPHGYLNCREAAARAGVEVVLHSHFEGDRERPNLELLTRSIGPRLGADTDDRVSTDLAMNARARQREVGP